MQIPELFRKTNWESKAHLYCRPGESNRPKIKQCCAGPSKTRNCQSFSSGGQHWPSYADLCKAISGDRLTIIDHLPQDLLASAYAAAAVHALPSWMETCGLVSLEAALCGTPLVGSLFGHELEYLEGDAWTCDPGDPDSVRKAVESAWAAGRQHSRPIAMKRKVLERFNWEQTVDSTERLYQRVLSNPRP